MAPTTITSHSLVSDMHFILGTISILSCVNGSCYLYFCVLLPSHHLLHPTPPPPTLEHVWGTFPGERCFSVAGYVGCHGVEE